MAQGLLHQSLHRGVVGHVSCLVEQAVLTMTGVGIQSHVGNHPHVRHGLTKRAHHPWHQSMGVERFFGVWCFAAGVHHGEKRQGTDP